MDNLNRDFLFFPLPKGVSLSNELCKLLAIRYGTPSLQINFENFVCFMLRVELMGGEDPYFSHMTGLQAKLGFAVKSFDCKIMSCHVDSLRKGRGSIFTLLSSNCKVKNAAGILGMLEVCMSLNICKQQET